MWCHHEESVDTSVHRLQRGARGVGAVAVRARHQQVQAARARGTVHAADQLRKILSMSVRQQEAHGMGAAVDETARRGVRHVTQLVSGAQHAAADFGRHGACAVECPREDRKSTRLNSSHVSISYAVFCLKKKKKKKNKERNKENKKRK